MPATASKNRGSMSPRRKNKVNTRPYSGKVAANIEAAREAAGLTVDELAQRLKVHVKTIYSWEANNSSPHVDDLPKLARALNVQVHDLIPNG